MATDTPGRTDGAEFFIGAMTGTSIDGLDLCLVDFSLSRPRLVAHHQQPLGTELTGMLRALATASHPSPLPGESRDSIDLLGMADRALAEATAEGIQALLDHAGVDPDRVHAIGSHGQTVRHRPTWGEQAFTMQVGDPSRIAELTGIPVAADFRRRDLAAGGQGAPLVPRAHAALFPPTPDSAATIVVNLGGIANLSILEPGREPQGFDTGPANTLLDAWHARHRGDPFDADGAWAASGRCDSGLLDRLLTDPYFTLAPPKSTGPEHFNLDWLATRADTVLGAMDAADVQATLLELTAISVAGAMRPWLPDSSDGKATEVIVCGGGARNSRLVERLRAQVESAGRARVVTSDWHGIPPECVEGAAFAWLARQLMRGEPGNAPAVTGARGARVLGGWYPA
ncbi:anhydro-N-acetylmuramic acid kinase [Guyparkeria sp.]|uniref:anhydro-N-acetylmuramic acid kinase n=1 Tax=Guyparkeria sp. TaxID=2035736 RepID=UPI00356B2123